MRVVLTAAARRDRREAEAWYGDASPAALSDFRRELRAAIEFLGDYPLGAPVLRGVVHAKRLMRFPYSLLYKVLKDRVRVIAVADERRDPGHYFSRLST